MKKVFVLLLLLFGLLLVGCKEEQQEGIIKDDVSVNESNITTRPPDLSLEYGQVGIQSINYTYCWNEENCSIQQKDPKGLTDLRSFSVNPGDVLSFFTSGSLSLQSTTPPDIIEVTHIHKGNESKIEVKNNSITTPTEKGVHFYNVYAKWEEEIKGEAYYAFKISVKE